MKVNGIDERRHHHHQHQNIAKGNSISKNDAAPLATSTIVGDENGAIPELQEKLIQTHPSKHHHSTVNKTGDDDDRDGSVSDGGSGSVNNNVGDVFVKRRKPRYTNGTLIRSHSFDNGKYNSVHGRMLIKSKTIGGTSSIALSRGGSQKKRNKTLSANGNHCSVDRLDETRTDSKRRRLFHTSNVDQSPLWTTLTHARTMSDFVFDSS